MATIGDLAGVSPSVLEGAVGKASGAHLARLSRAIDDRGVEPSREVKSVSHEETYPVDCYDERELHVEVVRMSDAVAARLRGAGMTGRTVTLKVRYGDFTTLTRSRTAPAGLTDGPAIAALGLALLGEVDLSPGVRLLGVGVSNLADAGAGPGQQMSLDLGDDGSSRGWRLGSASVAVAVDAIRERYGAQAVGPAALLGPRGLRIKRPGDTQWGPAGPEGMGTK
jgi:DNA polymerase-4